MSEQLRSELDAPTREAMRRQALMALLGSAATPQPSHVGVAEFDDSGMTPLMSAVLQRLSARGAVPNTLRAIRANPALESAKLDGQYVGDGVIELNPNVTDQAYMERLILHEMGHLEGTNEPGARFREANIPMASHAPRGETRGVK